MSKHRIITASTFWVSGLKLTQIHPTAFNFRKEGSQEEYRRVGCRRRRQLPLIIMGDSAAASAASAAIILEAAAGFIFGEETAKDHNYSFRSNFVTTTQNETEPEFRNRNRTTELRRIALSRWKASGSVTTILQCVQKLPVIVMCPFSQPNVDWFQNPLGSW